MSKWQPIVDELTTNSADYNGLTDQAAAAVMAAKTEPAPSGEIDPFLIDNVVPTAEREALKANAGAAYDKWQAILASNRPIDPLGTEMQEMLNALVPGVLSAETRTAIEDLGTVSQPIYTGWRCGKPDTRAIQKARKEMA